MKIELIKKQLQLKALKFLPVVVVLFVIFMVSYNYASSNKEKITANENKIRGLNAQIEQSRSDYGQSEKLLSEYLMIKKDKMPTPSGYAVGRDRLKVLLPVIQEMKGRYFFKKLNFSLSEIKKGIAPGVVKFDMYQNTISIDFAGATDEFVLSMINDLKILLPGYLNVSALTLVRELDINQETTNGYLPENGSAIVTGSVELEWTTLGMRDAVIAPGIPAVPAAVKPNGI